MAKASLDIRSLARAHTESALKVLQTIMNQPKAPPSARVAAAQCLLDRGWGKAAQAIGGSDDLPAIAIQQLVRKIIDPVQAKAPKPIVQQDQSLSTAKDLTSH